MENNTNKRATYEIAISETSPEMHDSAMREMASYNGAAFEPEVGIFWFDPKEEELFDVVSIPVSQLNDTQSTIGKLHKDVWAKKYYKAIHRGEKDSIYLTDYTQIPRGRVFIDRRNNRFIVKVGSWISDYASILTPLIREEFNLQDFTYDIDHHWDLGNGWSEHDFTLYAD